MNLSLILDRQVQLRPDAPAFLSAEKSLSFIELARASAAVAGGLAGLGVMSGDRVAVMLPNVLPFPIAAFAIWRLGAQLVPVNPLFKPQEVRHLLVDSGARVLIVLEQLLPALGELVAELGVQVVSVGGESGTPFIHLFAAPPLAEPAAIQPEDVVAVLYTSGTTGRPKGAMLTSRNLDYDSEACALTLEISPADRLYLVLPLFHAYGMTIGLLVCTRNGGSVFLEPRFAPLLALQHLKQFDCSVFLGVPALFAALLGAEGSSLQALRFCISGGAPLPVSLLTAFEAKFQTVILEGDGPTECSPVTAVNPLRGVRKTGSIGLPLAGQQMAIRDPETGAFLPDGEVGEILVRGPNVFKGYLNLPEETAGVFFEDWLRTGDLGYRDSDGYFYIVDRLKDLIIVAGLNVYAREVEEVLQAHPQVRMAAVVGEFDELRGEVVHAFVEAVGDQDFPDAQEIIRYCRERLADYKCPRRVTVLAELPRSTTGKILKRVLKEGFKGHPAT
ncbi:long-chain-fatty-acid--CoA ligase [Gloeobacter kilaueensis]|uniref:AMP-dependent synthetase and ligase n=1 Tax=Gloeobacter kilaueensis (strain ATCC BAA-2537 / CCAP 1431/1 / ULC 316 / JS1) TaxID=1183438 RepID=U5QFV0_GLOK1|nr:long-chain fatty acid--CoA ligase [Gloeobacter kilaueensis]AGY56499.1 AMP-dependent synthetase and ligase [Gloeobacter kilaueensis JS1]